MTNKIAQFIKYPTDKKCFLFHAVAMNGHIYNSTMPKWKNNILSDFGYNAFFFFFHVREIQANSKR